MERSLVYRIALVAVLMVVSVVALIPTFFWDWKEGKSGLPEWWQTGIIGRVLPQNNLNLGLDLQGGMDLVISVNVEDAVIKELRYFEEGIKDSFKREDIAYRRIETVPADKRVRIQFEDGKAMHKGQDYLIRNYKDLAIAAGKDELEQEYTLTETAETSLRLKSVEQVKNVLTRRIDAFGLREPEIVIQGENQVRLQLPGASDPERIKKQLVRTAMLDFMIVEAIGVSREPADVKNGGRPADKALATWVNPFDPDQQKIECYFEKDQGVSEGPVSINRRLSYNFRDPKDPDPDNDDKCYLLREDLAMSGKDLKDARAAQDPDPLSNSYMISFTWEMKAAQRFAKITGENIGKQLAVVLEGAVHSAPVIQSKIFNRGQITGSFTLEDAVDLSNVLKSGSLNVGITFEEERTVGASLGADSIHKGQVAMFWGSISVVIFMVIYYSMGGVIADFALLLNILFIFAALSLFGATLTLPGLAGIVLTIGMAVDANVLIFERVREELRFGKTPYASIDAGYAKAFWTIFDANITTLIAALVLLQWGTGPIKGFAITLSIGIATSMFTAIVVTRIVYDVLFYLKRGSSLSIGIKFEPASNNVKRPRA